MTVSHLEGVVLPPGEWTPEHAAAYVTDAWQHAVESIVETGRRLIEAKEGVAEGNWLRAVALMPFGESAARKLMQIARHPDFQDQEHVTDLPASWGTLAVLAQLPRLGADFKVVADLDDDLSYDDEMLPTLIDRKTKELEAGE